MIFPTPGSSIGRRIFYHWANRETHLWDLLVWHRTALRYIFTQSREDTLCRIRRKITLISHNLLSEPIYQGTLTQCPQQTSCDSSLLLWNALTARRYKWFQGPWYFKNHIHQLTISFCKKLISSKTGIILNIRLGKESSRNPSKLWLLFPLWWLKKLKSWSD